MSRKQFQQKKRTETAKQKKAATLKKYKEKQKKGFDLVINWLKEDMTKQYIYIIQEDKYDFSGELVESTIHSACYEELLAIEELNKLQNKPSIFMDYYIVKKEIPND
jgi:hypothetical protein